MPKSSGVKKPTKKSISKFYTRKELSPNISEITKRDLSQIISMAKFATQRDCYTIKMVIDFVATTDGSGVWATVSGDDPSADSNWASAAAFFDEYRTLATTFHFAPNVTSGGSLLTYTPIAVVTDLDSSAALTGYTLASQYSSVREFKGNSGFTYLAMMTGLENATFLSTASHANRWYVKTYTSGNSASTVIGRVQICHYVQFRGKGI